MEIARQEGITHIQGMLLPEAAGMRHIFEKFGFTIHKLPDREAMRAEIDV
jgi:hypothetical protein